MMGDAGIDAKGEAETANKVSDVDNEESKFQLSTVNICARL